MHICVDKLTIIGSDNGLSPGRRQAIIWTNAGNYFLLYQQRWYTRLLQKRLQCHLEWLAALLGCHQLIGPPGDFNDILDE